MGSPSTDVAQHAWPELPYDAWKDTYVTLHMWTQVVGKVAVACAPPLNHSWGSAFLFTPRGLQTHLLAHDSRSFTITFDFLDHQLVIETSDRVSRTLPLAPQSVAEFYHEVMAALDGMGLRVRIWSMPVEVASPIRFEGGSRPSQLRPGICRTLVAHRGASTRGVHGMPLYLCREVQSGPLLLGSF